MKAQLRSRNKIADFESCDLALVFENIPANEVTVFNAHPQGASNGEPAASQRRTNQVELPVGSILAQSFKMTSVGPISN